MKKRLLNVASSEAIGIQVNDASVQELVELSGMVKGFVDGRIDLIGGIRQPISKMEKIIQSRFGFQVKIITDTNSLMGVRLVGFNTHGGLESFKALTDAFSKSYLQPQQIMNFREGVMKLDQWARVRSLKIDEYKANISGLPNNFSVEIFCNIVALFSPEGKYKMEPREFVAMLLHEVGHVFTYISYSWKTRASRITFEDSLSSSTKKGMDNKRAFLLAYKEAYDPNLRIDDYKNVPFPFAVIGVLKKYKDRYRYDLGMKDDNQAELLADQFVARFGLGDSLTSALSKVTDVKFTSSRNFSTATDSIYSVICIGLLGVLTAGAVFAGILAALLAGVTAIIVIGIIYLCYDLTISSIANFSGGYDEDDSKRLERLESVYLDYIRQLRTNENIDPNVKQDILAQLDVIKRIIEDMKGKGVENLNTYRKKGVVNSIFNFFNISNSRDYNNMAELDKLLESLSENDLHLSAQKLKFLLK